jgi:tRNA 2-selenouridine synthase
MVEPSREPRRITLLPAVNVAQVLSAPDAVVIDLRSPSEFALDHIPGAHNLPLFDDGQRALVGTLYRRESPEAAFQQGREIVRAHVGELARNIAQRADWRLEPGDLEARVMEMTASGIDGLMAQVACEPARAMPPRAVVLHCWRGGMRSQSVAALVRGLGLERAVVLQGGYKSYRAHVVQEIASFAFPPAFVLRGLTGVGKTLVLREIARLHPDWTLDLEELAGHRSSLLGMVGLEPCSQKMFESRLAQRLRRGFPGFFVVEGESRRVGDILLHARLWRAISEGTNLELRAGIERRIRVLEEDYLRDDESRTELMRQLPAIEERMVRKAGAESLTSMLARDAVEELVTLLLERYYDPRYSHGQRGKVYSAAFDASDPVRAAAEICAWIRAASAPSGSNAPITPDTPRASDTPHASDRPHASNTPRVPNSSVASIGTESGDEDDRIRLEA